MKRLLLLIVFFSLGFISAFKPPQTFAAWYKYPDNPVLSTSNIECEFDSVNAGAPSVLFNGSLYQMWYEGYNGSSWNIGYTTSSDGLNWTNRQPINIDISSDTDVSNIHDPYVLYENGMYKMWYAASDSGFSFIHINYATSSDGINWNLVSKNLISTTLYWETSDHVSFPTVIHNEDGYKMWFGGAYWDGFRIGLATSTDGLNWTQFPDFVTGPTQSWENSGLGGPHVIYNDKTYEMYYHSGTGIGYATSQDGITWVKHVDNPIIEPSVDTEFESWRILNPFVLKLQGKNVMWYNGETGNYIYQIGYAQDQPFEPPEPNPIIFIPGMGAGWNRDDLLSCNIQNSGDWTMAPYVDVYHRLINTFTDGADLELNKDFYVYTYDWRQNLAAGGSKFADYINTISADHPGRKFDVIGHSLGGLVARSYITQNPDNKIDKLITLGSPHQGTVVAYPAWENGDIWNNNLTQSVAIKSLINICRLRMGGLNTNRKIVQILVPSFKDILPTFDFLIKNNNLVTTDLIEGENGYLKANPFTSPFNNVDFYTLSGNDHDTLEFLTVKNPNLIDRRLWNWQDGKPDKKRNTRLGDGTVLNLSSLMNDANQTTINTDECFSFCQVYHLAN